MFGMLEVWVLIVFEMIWRVFEGAVVVCLNVGD